jgi:lipoprotein-anchoring transpeptidase ErfK/SrfK
MKKAALLPLFPFLILAFPATADPIAPVRVASVAVKQQFDAWSDLREVRYVRPKPRDDDEDDYPQPQQPRYQQPQQPYWQPQRPGPGGGGLLELLFTPQNGNIFAPGARQPQSPYEEMARPGFDPRYARQLVDFPTPEKPGTVIIDTNTRYLYLVQEDGQALRYGVGVGRPGFEWRGVKSVSAKKEWPDWRPPAEMLMRRPDLPVHMVGGPANPLGARAIYLGSSLYRIHGSNEPQTIGTAVSSGCFRMRNEDVIDLYNRVKVGTKVVVI